tara:strand:+ start:6119 stop:6232 length:114 start_codon:yes stop_codon:yes gene_type:complete
MAKDKKYVKVVQKKLIDDYNELSLEDLDLEEGLYVAS